MSEKNRRREVKVGMFVTFLTAAIGMSLFFVGGSMELLQDRYTISGSWEDVSGLKEGAVVRLAGWDVGEVVAIRFSDDIGVKEIFVTMNIMTDYQPRIRKDSEARIDTVGVLGDKYVAISMGDPSEPIIAGQDWINTRPALDVLEYTKKIADVLDSTASIGHKVDLMLGTDDDASKASLSGSFEHLEKMLAEAESGDGLLHALIYDDTMTKSVNNSLRNLDLAMANLRSVTYELKNGDGLAHELVYGSDGATLARELSELATNLSQLTSDLKSEDSLIHSLIYDPSKVQLMDDLVATTSALRQTADAINAGEGSIGMLARDPALYEDLRALVGGAQRNKLLRAYIRTTVQKGEEANASPWEPAEE